MVPKGIAAYGKLCGWTLARAHARSGDRIAIAAYLGNGDSFDRAIVEFSKCASTAPSRTSMGVGEIAVAEVRPLDHDHGVGGSVGAGLCPSRSRPMRAAPARSPRWTGRQQRRELGQQSRHAVHRPVRAAAVKPRRALLRWIGMVLAALPLFAGYLVIPFDRRRRGWHDRLARTVVVDAPGISPAELHAARNVGARHPGAAHHVADLITHHGRERGCL
jgi:hypothetical protein